MATIAFCAILLFFCLWLLRGIHNPHYVHSHNNSFTIIICVKNEAQNLIYLLVSLRNIDYFEGNYEVLFIDDHSTDQSFVMLSDFCLTSERYDVFQLPEGFSGKKSAITYGIERARYDWIALTDADCLVAPQWLNTVNNYIENNKQISMFVGYSPECFVNSWQYFKQLAHAIIYASSIYSGFPFSCSGRNLVFSRQGFEEVHGYMGVTHLTSGDDKLLLKKFNQAKKGISYIPHPPIFSQVVGRRDIKDQNLRRYGKVLMSSRAWIFFIGVLGLLLIAMPVEIALTKRFAFVGIYLFTIELLVLLGCLLHKERFRLWYLPIAPVFPYYLFFQTLLSFFIKWKWRGE